MSKRTSVCYPAAWAGELTVLIMVTLGAQGCAVVAHAEEWSRTYPVGGPAEIAVDASYANVRVGGSPTGAVEVNVSAIGRRGSKDRLEVTGHQAGAVVELHVQDNAQRQSPRTAEYAVEIAILVPRDSRVRIRLSDGAIHVADIKGTLELDSGDGLQEITGFEGTLHAHTGDGAILATGRFDGLELANKDGRIVAEALPGSTVTSPWKLSLGDGKVNLKLPKGLGVNLTLHCGDGSIMVDVPMTVQGRLTGKDVAGQVNGGGGVIDVRVGDGVLSVTN